MKQISMLDLKKEGQIFRDEIKAGIDEVLDSCAFVSGPQVVELEEKLAKYCGVLYGIAVSSGTDALLNPLMAMGVGPGDEVITSVYTFFATAGSIARSGAKPVFVDIEPDTFNMDVSALAKAITPKTKAVIPVHLYGQCVDMDEVRAITDPKGIPTIEDCAQAIGAVYCGRRACSLGTVAALSFYPTKNLGAFGDAGMVLTDDLELAEKFRKCRWHGQTESYYHGFVGGNFRMNTFQGVVLNAKFDHLREFNTKRQNNAKIYDEMLASAPVKTPVVRDYNEHVYHQYCILAERRDELQAYLKDNGIASGIYYPVPLHMQPCLSHLGYKEGDFPVAEKTAKEILALPIHPMLEESDVQYVAEKICEFYK